MMVRIRRGVSQESLDLPRRMEQMMQGLLRSLEAAPAGPAWAPRIDIFETAEGLILSLEVPGVERGDIEIIVQGAYLSVSGHRAEPTASGCMRWHQMEIVYGPFERVVALPREVDPEQISATYKDGFLRIEIPHGASSARRVPIESP